MASEWMKARVDLATDLTTIANVPCLVKGAYINTQLSDHACEVKDGSSNAYTIPANAAPGNAYAFGPARYETSLIVDPDNAATGSITIDYVKLGEAHA